MSDRFFILHGEDDVVDVRVMKGILGSIGFDGEYKDFSFGPEVLDYLLMRGAYDEGDHRLPDLIILDIGLPGCDGKEILQTLRGNKATQGIPIIMSSGSCSLRDYRECMALGGTAYIQKTSDSDNFKQTFKLFLEGWQRLKKQEFF